MSPFAIFTGLSPRTWFEIGLGLMLAAALAIAGIERTRRAGVEVKLARNIAAHAEADKLQAIQNRTIERDWAEDSAAAQTRRIANEKTLKAAGARLDDELAGVRNDAAIWEGIAASAPAHAVRAYAATAEAVFGHCAREYSGMAKEAAGHAADSLMYQQSWPKPPTLAPEK